MINTVAGEDHSSDISISSREDGGDDDGWLVTAKGEGRSEAKRKVGVSVWGEAFAFRAVAFPPIPVRPVHAWASYRNYYTTTRHNLCPSSSSPTSRRRRSSRTTQASPPLRGRRRSSRPTRTGPAARGCPPEAAARRRRRQDPWMRRSLLGDPSSDSEVLLILPSKRTAGTPWRLQS